MKQMPGIDVMGMIDALFEPSESIPGLQQLSDRSDYAYPYKLAWQESHSRKGLSDAIESVRERLGVTYDLASSLVWVQLTAPSPVVPASRSGPRNGIGSLDPAQET
jgi:hypothetical protein